MVLTIICAIGAILKAIKTKMDLNNLIIPDTLVNKLIILDIVKAVITFGVFYFQLKVYKRKEYLTSILLYFVAIFIYNLRYFFQ